MTYREFKRIQEEKANEFTKDKMFFAFGTSEDEVKAKLEEQGVDVENVVGVGAGTYILKDSYDDVLRFFDNQAKEFKEYTLNNLNDVLTYEFANHELEISLSYSYRSFLTEWVGLSEDEIEENKDEINKAIADYRKDFYEHN